MRTYADLRYNTAVAMITSPSRRASYSLATYYLGEHIHLKNLQADLKEYEHLNHDHPLVLKLGERKYAAVTKFGTVTFWNASQETTDKFVASIAPFIDARRGKYEYHDTLEVRTGMEKEKVTFEDVHLRALDLEKIKIISYISAQSVGLERYEDEIDVHLRELGKVVESLRSSGSTRLDRKELLMQVGNALSIKQHAVSSLALFDKPNETWENEDIERLYGRLRAAYELKDRFDILNEKIDFLSENNTTLINFISAERANALEIIVIVLIAVELVPFLLELARMFLKTP